MTELRNTKKRVAVALQRRMRRNRAIKKMGGKCVQCGCDNCKMLEFDHVNNDGAAHRKEIIKSNGWNNKRSLSSDSMVKWLEDNNYPDMVQLLCANCNKLKELKRYDERLREKIKELMVLGYTGDYTKYLREELP